MSSIISDNLIASIEKKFETATRGGPTEGLPGGGGVLAPPSGKLAPVGEF